MTARRPPRLVIALLSRLPADREPLIGDLLEEFQHRRSRWWLWRQALAVTGRDLVRPRAPLGLGLDPAPRREACPAPMRGIGSVGTPPVGGLGVLAIAILLTVVVPGVWWVLLATVAGGVAVGVGFVLRRHWAAGLAFFVLLAASAAA